MAVAAGSVANPAIGLALCSKAAVCSNHADHPTLLYAGAMKPPKALACLRERTSPVGGTSSVRQPHNAQTHDRLLLPGALGNQGLAWHWAWSPLSFWLQAAPSQQVSAHCRSVAAPILDCRFCQSGAVTHMCDHMLISMCWTSIASIMQQHAGVVVAGCHGSSSPTSVWHVSASPDLVHRLHTPHGASVCYH